MSFNKFEIKFLSEHKKTKNIYKQFFLLISEWQNFHPLLVLLCSLAAELWHFNVKRFQKLVSALDKKDNTSAKQRRRSSVVERKLMANIFGLSLRNIGALDGFPNRKHNAWIYIAKPERVRERHNEKN